MTSLKSLITIPSGDSISSPFNYNPTSGEISGFGSSLAPGASSTSAGFILVGSGVPTLASYEPSCPCAAAATPAPAVATPTSAPVATSAPTSAPTAADCNNQCASDEVCVALESSTPTCQPRTCSNIQCSSSQICIDDGGVARCIADHSSPRTASAAAPAATSAPVVSCASESSSVSVSVFPRTNGAFTDANGVNNQIWDLVITNKASSPISDLSIKIVSSGVITEMWNLAQTNSATAYSVSTFGALSSQGASYYGAGFSVAGASAPPTVCA